MAAHAEGEVTLAEVATHIRRDYVWDRSMNADQTRFIVSMFEADPDFKLRERVETALAMGESDATPTGWDQWALDIFRKALNPPKVAP